MNTKMKIAVIGAGYFGVTIASTLAKDNLVDLYEKNSDILMAGSDVNQCRVHRGYHYPRSDETVQELLNANESFRIEFEGAIMNSTDNYYAIAKKDSSTSASEYLKFCQRNNLNYTLSQPSILDDESIDLCVKVKENLFDHKKIKKICWEKLQTSGVNMLLNTEAKKEDFDKYDLVIICTYGDWGLLLDKNTELKQDFQFEVCEKVFVKLPPNFKNISLLVMDGPFMSIDPVGETGMFIIGDVVHTVRQRKIGKSPAIDPKYLPYINKGILSNVPISNYKLFIESASKFMPELQNAEYVGSSFCVKTTLSNVDKTDKRPTVINQINKKIITVFSGKIPTCVSTAQEISKIVYNTSKNNF
jgi:hypothetical protein